MIEQNKYVAKQLTGPIVNAMLQVAGEEWEAIDASLYKRFKNWRISSEFGENLDKFAALLGYNRPFASNVLVQAFFSDLPPFEGDFGIAHGLSDLVDSTPVVAGMLCNDELIATEEAATDEAFHRYIPSCNKLREVQSIDALATMVDALVIGGFQIKIITTDARTMGDIEVMLTTELASHFKETLQQMVDRMMPNNPKVTITIDPALSQGA